MFDYEETEDLESRTKCWEDDQNCLQEAGYDQGFGGLWRFRHTADTPLPHCPPALLPVCLFWGYVNMSKSRICPVGLQ